MEQLLSLAQYDDAGSEQQAPITAFDHVVKDVVSDFLPLAEARSVDLGFERNESVSIRADATALAVLVCNLIDNALRHTPEGGRIDINLFREGGRAVLRVEDTGSGIPEAAVGRIFEPFYRSSQAEGDGTGLGLSIARRIADRLAGSIELENIAAQDRSGLRVIVSIPIVGKCADSMVP
jgi:two-component system OmpR family sensor kinase